MSNTIDITNLTDDGLDAVMAVAAGGSCAFDGKYSNADCAAIAAAFEKKTGKRPPQYWIEGLRR